MSKIQIERENANSLLETTIHCKDIAALMLKTRQQIESDDHYSAMRTIEIIKIEMVESTAKPLVKVLESWLPMTINKLLYGARSEADTVITKIRSNMDLIGQTVMIRQARTAIHLPMDYIISNNSTNNYNSNSNSIGGCISLERLNSFGQIFRLDKWGKQKDFQGIIPYHYQSNVTKEGIDAVESVINELGPLHKVLHLYAILGTE